jgi:hypothetical protein
VAERPIPNWADVSGKYWHQSKISGINISTLCKQKITTELNFQNRPEGRNGAEMSVPNWVEYLLNCNTKIIENSIFVITLHYKTLKNIKIVFS